MKTKYITSFDVEIVTRKRNSYLKFLMLSAIWIQHGSIGHIISFSIFTNMQPTNLDFIQQFTMRAAFWQQQ